MFEKREKVKEDSFAQIHEWFLTYIDSDDKKTKQQLRNLITVASMPFVKHIAYGLARRSTDPVEDLVQVGALGLIKSIEHYNPQLGTKFKTYATYFITGEIRHYLRDKASMIKAPREIQELSFRVNCVIKELTKNGKEPTFEEVAESMSLSVSKIQDAVDVDRRKNTLSLDQTLTFDGEDTMSLGDKISSGDYQDFLSSYEQKIMLSGAISKLKPKLKDVLELSYYEDLTQREISDKLGISQMQVSRRLKKALGLMYSIITRGENCNAS